MVLGYKGSVGEMYQEKLRDTKINIFYIYMACHLHSSYTAHEPHCTLQFNVLMQRICVDFHKHMLLSFTGNISGDIIDELMSSDGKYLASLLF